MPLFTKTTLISALLSIPVFGSAVIGANYASPILHHLVDIVNGSNTQTVASLNAPNWAAGAPLATPIATSAATTTGGSVASSTAVYFAVAALDSTGTTTLSNVVNATTDASSTLLGAEGFNLSWGAVTGATGYAVYLGTSASSLTSYVLATSTNGTPNTTVYIASTTASVLNGSNTQTDTTAFATKINPVGQSYLNGGGLQVLGQTLIGTTTAASSSQMEINGYVRASLSATSTGCFSATKGEMFFNTSNGIMWGCNGTNWIKIF